MTEKYKLQQEDINSMDLNGDTLAKLKQILPEVFAEGADGKPSIDIERLKIALGSAVDVESDNKSRFSFGWSGKKQAQALANQPSTATLRPSIDDSKNWDNTQNVYIEGDNLEVLKLLQKSYYGQIKMIYIDPPYNTGKDFVYKDNFHDNVKNYLQLTGQVDDEGNKISTNTDKSGRYHTDWLNMMYPRLKLARNLLKDDGVIFISIDDNEVHNLRKICDEIFGEDNFVEQFIWKSGRTAASIYTREHEYILAYSKNKESVQLIKYNGNDEDTISDRTIKKISVKNPASEISFNAGIRFEGTDRIFPNSFGDSEAIEIVEGTLECNNGALANNVIIKAGWAMKDMIESWLDGEEVIDSKGQLLKEFYFEKNGVLKYVKERGTVHPKTIITDISTKDGTNQLKLLLGFSPFDFPKTPKLINYLSMIVEKEDIILDFFSGSATTAHAVMQLNANDGGNRKYICVQLPELTYYLNNDGNEVAKKECAEAYKAGYKNICEIGKERIRRAGEKVLAEWTEKQQKSAQASANAGLFADDAENNTAPTSLDIGFKVFKLDTSNIKPFDANDMFATDLLVANRSALDLFYELVLKQGYSLDNRQCVLDIGGTSCYALVHEDNTPFVLAVLDDTIKQNFALELLKYALTLVIVKDACFGTDEIKLNLLATLEQLQSKDNPLQIRIV